MELHLADPRRRQRPLRDAVFQQPEEVRAAPDRNVPRAAHRPRQVGVPVELDPRHGPLLWHQPVPRRILGHDRRARQPAGANRHHQEGAGADRARVRGAKRAYFVTNGTSTSNKIVVQAICTPGRHRDRRPQLPQVAPLRAGAGGRAAVLRRGISAHCSIRCTAVCRSWPSRRRCSTAWRRARSIASGRSTSPTARSTGTCTTPSRVMEECLAIKPDLIFLWDEAWFGFARFNAFHRRRTAMGAAAALTARFRNPAYRAQYQQAAAAAGPIDAEQPAAARRRRCCPIPTRCASASIRPARRTSRCQRCGRARRSWSGTRTFTTSRAASQEAFLTHTSTSPNLQIIASLDVARRQMELEGYELTMRAAEIAFRIRREVNGHPLISQLLPHRHAGRDGAVGVPGLGHRRTTAGRTPPGRTLHRRVGRRRVRARPDAADARLRVGRLRRHAVQDAAGGPVRHPGEQDVAQQRAAADQHQQHAQRRRAAAQGAGRPLARDRAASSTQGGKAARAQFVSARAVADGRTCRTCRTSATSTTSSATTRPARQRAATCATRSSWPTTQRTASSSSWPAPRSTSG